MKPATPLCLTLLLACVGAGDPSSDTSNAGEPERWSLSAEPVVSIGVVEGDEEYQLFRASASVELPDGAIAVLNGGTSEVRIFEPDGAFRSAFGGQGDGPGEFRAPSRMQLQGEEFRIWDARAYRLSFHTLDGGHLRREGLDPAADSLFPGDVWLYRRHLIDSPIPPAARGPIARAIDAFPTLDSLQVTRHVRLSEQGRLWVHDRPLPSEHPVDVTVYGLDGTPLAELTLPPRFEVHSVGHDHILGRAFDELGVNFIVRHRIEKPAPSPSGPGIEPIAAGDGTTFRTANREISDEVRTELLSVPRALASQQEIHYSQHYTYTPDISVLEVELPESILVDILQGDDRGWSGIFVHHPTGSYCALGYGFTSPMGWPGGAVICPAR